VKTVDNKDTEEKGTGGAYVAVGHARSPSTLVELIDACVRKDIDYEESKVFTHLRGVVVTCGRSSVISVRASLSEADKKFTLAHELGHVALGHTSASAFEYQIETHDMLKLPSDEKDHDASIWAAHLLVDPEAYDACLSEAQVEFGDSDLAYSTAIVNTAQSLGIPAYAVELWLETRDRVFSEDPKAWLAESSD
jgi:IrrE N-terminal-like domain